MKQYTLIYRSNGVNRLTFDFYADSKGLADDHAHRLCNDNGWTFVKVERK